MHNPGSAEPQLGSKVPAAELAIPGSAEPQLGSNVPAAELGLGVPRDVPKGYKRTEVGVIPEEWETSTIGEEFNIQLGKMLDSEKNIGVPKPFLGNRSVQWGRVDVSDLGTIKLTNSDIERFRLREGDLLVCEGGEVGRAAIWTKPLDECYYQKALHRLRTRRGYSVEVASYLLHRYASVGALSDFVTQTSIAHLPKDKFEKLPIPVPPSAEQRAIAEALGDVDALLGALDAAIAKQRDLKQAAMQQLLTGQTRLPGFQGEWEVKRFGELTVPRKDRVDPSQPDVKGLCIELEHIESGAGRLLGCAEIRQGSSLKSCFYAGDILFGKLRAYLKKFWLADREGFCSTEIWVFATDSNKMAAGFLSQIVRTADFVDAASLSYGTHMPRSDWKVLQNFEVRVPCIDEQQAIAAILSDIDTALTTLESRRTKTAALKQAMMQELLTGRIRLPGAPGTSPARVTLGTPSPSSARVDSRAELGLGAPRDGASRDGAPRDDASGTRLV